MSGAHGSSLSLSTPLIPDLNNNGVLSQGIEAGVHFDLFASGQQSATCLTDPGDEFLVFDRDGDGRINEGTELFGDATVLAIGRVEQ